MQEYEIHRDGHTFKVLLDDEHARAWGLLEAKGDKSAAEEHATAPKAETRTRKPKA